jgi:glycosyltransferase involved in cell wall biosynthesis
VNVQPSSSVQAQHLTETAAEPSVSVIIPAYNVGEYIGDALDSVFAQTFKDFEIIVINDGSPDTDDLEARLADYMDRIKYLKQPNLGAGAARNAGLRVAKGRFVAFLDGDDAWLSNFLEDQLRLIESDGGYDLVYADAINFGDGGSSNKTNMDFNPSHGRVTFEKLAVGKCNVITSAVLVRREALMRVGGFNESFRNSQDFDLWLRLLKDAQGRFTYQKRVLVRRRIHASSLSADPIKSFMGEVAVLSAFQERGDISPEHQALLNAVVRKRQATMEVIRGKRHLLKNDFDEAYDCFVTANKELHSWKLTMVSVAVRVAPQLLRSVYKYFGS